MLTHCGTLTIETERLILRRFKAEDESDALRYWAGDAEVQKMYGEPVYETAEAVRGLLGKYMSAYEREDVYRWSIELRETGACIGQIAYFLVDSKNHFAEIEYCVGVPFQRRGLATEATKAVIAYGFDCIGLHKVQICHKSINEPSRRVIEKCGFTHEGTLRDFFFMDDRYVDRLYYSMLEAEYARIGWRGEEEENEEPSEVLATKPAPGSVDKRGRLEEAPFAYSASKDGKVQISWHGKPVMHLKGTEAARFLSRVQSADEREAQLAMAKVTGNFKHGNEKNRGNRHGG